MSSPIIQKLTNLFSKFPTIGSRTANRFVFYLIRLPQNEFNEFIETLKQLKQSIKICSFCFNHFETTNEQERFCPICQNGSRDKNLLCVIEKEQDLISIEKTNKYKGFYFILGGTISSFKEEDIKKLRINELEQRLKNSNFQEIIIATNPTIDGEATALYLIRKLKNILSPEIKITQLAKGLPIGGELEYADEETLENAFSGRK
ncbi:MAG: recombination mediator RecR [Candidatus Nealsonbacteria bacterium]